MYGRERRDWLCILPLFWLGLRCVSAQGVGAQIIAALERYRVAVVQMDYDDEIAAFADDAELSQGNDPPLHGRAQIRAQIQAQAAFKVVAYELHAAVTRVEGSIAVQNGAYSQRIISPQHQPILSKGVFEVQWTRQADGAWRISRLHTDAVEDGS
jgi:ketosteroid isomerase-like protein